MADTVSASKLDRLEVCPASGALPCVFEPSSDDATKGTEFHESMKRVRTGNEAPGTPDWHRDLFAELTAGATVWLRERCFAFDPKTGYGRDLGTHERDYSGLREREIGGTVDLVALRGKSATVYDYKTGFLGADIDTAQLAHNALAVAYAYGLDEVEVALVLVDLDGESYRVVRKTLDVFALADQAQRVSNIVGRVADARARFEAGAPLDVTESDDGCRYCPCKQSCPAKTQAISLVLRAEHVALPTAEELLANATPERAATAWVLAKALEELAANVRRIVADRAQVERLPLPDGSYLTAVAVEREGIADVDAALTALRPMLGDAVDAAVVTTRKLSKGAVEAVAAASVGKGGGAKAKRAAVEVLRNAGALKTSVHYEVKRKASLPMSIRDGYYDCRATGAAEYGFSSNNNDQIAVEIEILEDLPPGSPDTAPRTVLGKAWSKLTFSPKAAEWSIGKLRALGFSGTRLDQLDGLGSTVARCKGETTSFMGNDGQERSSQDWDIVTGSGKPFKDDKTMDARAKARLAERFAAMCGGEAPAPAARAQRPVQSYGPQGTAGRSRNDGPPPMQGDDDFGGL